MVGNTFIFSIGVHMRMGYDEILSRQQALTDAFAAGTLTEAMLDREVETVVEDPGDGPSRSIGYEWMYANVLAFRQVVPNASAFLRRHLGVREFAGLVVLHAKLLRFLPAAERAEYVRDSILRHGAWNMGWIPAALAACVTRQALAAIVLEKLEATTVERCCANFVEDFLKHGCGYINPRDPVIENDDTPWSVLTDVQLIDALKICARKAPISLLHAHVKIELRLGKERAQAIFIAVADDLCHLYVPEVIQTLPFATRLALAKRLTVPRDWVLNGQAAATLCFIAALALEMAGTGQHKEAAAFFDERKSIFEGCNAALLYRGVLPMLTMDDPSKMRAPTSPRGFIARRIRQWLEETALPADGWECGVIRQGERFNRRTNRKERQWQVTSGQHLFVQDRRQHSYSPNAGDVVFYKPGFGYQLTQRVRAVTFVPADPNKQY